LSPYNRDIHRVVITRRPLDQRGDLRIVCRSGSGVPPWSWKPWVWPQHFLQFHKLW